MHLTAATFKLPTLQVATSAYLSGFQDACASLLLASSMLQLTLMRSLPVQAPATYPETAAPSSANAVCCFPDHDAVVQDQMNSVARFLEGRGLVAEALEVATDSDYRSVLTGH